MLIVLLIGALTSSILDSPALAQPTRYPGAIDDLRIAKGGRDIAEAWLTEPVTRYRHGVFGQPYEAGGLAVRLRDGELLTLTLDPLHVFEDRQPRLADLDGDGRDEVVLVLSRLDTGAALAVYGVRNGAITELARTAHIGRPNRWLAPAAIADVTGDGRLEIAFVAMPHLIKRLDVYRYRGGRLTRIAQTGDVSNHGFGMRFLGMAASADLDQDGRAELILPSGDRRTIRVLTYHGGTLREAAHFALKSPAAGDFRLRRAGGGYRLDVPLQNGQVGVLTLEGLSP
jgi:hypothetical protein